jgi:glycosyltransferase involved in cell wall biosynthesis
LDVQVPRGENDAGSYAALQEIRLIQSLGFKVTFLPLNLAYLGNNTERLQRMGVEAVYFPFTPSIEDFLQRRGNEFDAVYITRYSVARRYLETVRKHSPRAKVLFCNADLHFLREIRESIVRNSDELRDKAVKTREVELDVISSADVTLSYSFVEHAVIESHQPGSKVTLGPWVVEVPDKVPGFSTRRNIAFLGGFEHAPNLLAVEFFASEVMPLLRSASFTGEFLVYGSGLAGRDVDFGSQVRVVGYVDDIRTAYDSCRIFVAPLVSGAGLKGKVVDALALGVPSVISPIAAEGTTLQNGLETYIARTPAEWADAILRVYSDKALWEAMSEAARDHARRHYSFAAGQRLMERAFEIAGVIAMPDPAALVVKTARPS